MYLRKEEANILLKQLDSVVKNDIKESIKTLGALAEDNDWAFVLKSHSLVESLVNDLLMSRIGEIELQKTIQYMPLHDSKSSKVDILKSYNLLDKESFFFLRKFSELRNTITHSFEKVNFNFSGFYESLDKNQKRAWLKTVTWYADDTTTRNIWADVLDRKSKYAFLIALQCLLFSLYIEMHLAKGRNEIDKVAEERTKILLEKII